MLDVQNISNNKSHSEDKLNIEPNRFLEFKDNNVHKTLIHITKRYLPNEFIFLLYNNPSHFFQQQIYNELLSQPTLIDITNTSIFEHFYTAKTLHKTNTLYNQNEYSFFTSLKDKLELTLSLSKNTFLHFLSKYKNDIQMINKLFEYKCINAKLISLQNKKGELFYEDILKYVPYNKQIQNKEQYITLFNYLMSFPKINNKLLTLNDKNSFLFLIYNNGVFHNKNIKKEPLLIVNTIKQFPKHIDSYFVNKFIYMEEIDFNLLDVLIENELWSESKEVIRYLESVVTEKTNYNLWLVSHFYHFLEKVDLCLNFDIINDYVNCIIDAIKTISTGVSTFWNKTLYNKNIFHYLFSNKTAAQSFVNLKLLYKSINELFLYENKEYQIQLLSLQKSKLCVCFIPSLYLLNTYQGEIDFDFEEFFNNISQYYLQKKQKFGKYGLYMLQYFINTNQPRKLEFVYLNLLKKENNKQLNIYLSRLILYPSEKNIDLFNALNLICEEINDNQLYYRFISNNICFIKLCDVSNWINSSIIRYDNFDLFKVIIQNSFFTFDDIKQLWLVIFNTLDKLSLIIFVKNILSFSIQSNVIYQKIIDLIKSDYMLLKKIIFIDKSQYEITFSEEMVDISLIYDILCIDKGNVLSLKQRFSTNSSINYIFISFYLFIDTVSQKSKNNLYELLYNANIITIKKDILQLIVNYYNESIEVYNSQEYLKQNEIEQSNIINQNIEKNMSECWFKYFKDKNIIEKIKYNLMGYYFLYLYNKINACEYNQLAINILTNPDISNTNTLVTDKNLMKLKLLNFMCPINYDKNIMTSSLKRLYEILNNKLKSKEIKYSFRNTKSLPLIDRFIIHNLLRNNIICEHLLKVIEQKEQKSLISYLLLSESIYNEYINLYFWYLPPQVLLFIYNNQIQNIFYNDTLRINPFLFLLNKNTKNSMFHYVSLFQKIMLHDPYTNETNSKYSHEFPRHLNQYFPYELNSKENRFFTNSQQFINSIGKETFISFLNKHYSFKESFCQLLNCFFFEKRKLSILTAKLLPTIFSFSNKQTHSYKLLNGLIPYVIKLNMLNISMLQTILHSIQPISEYYGIFKLISIYVICYGTDELKKEFLGILFTSLLNLQNEDTTMKYSHIINLILLYSIFMEDLDLFISITNLYKLNTKEKMNQFIINNDFPVDFKTLKCQKKTNEFIKFVLLNKKFPLHLRMIKCFSIKILRYCYQYQNDGHINNNNSQSDGFVVNYINYDFSFKNWMKEIEIKNKTITTNDVQNDLIIGNNFIHGKYIIKKNKTSILCLFYNDHSQITSIYHSFFPLSNKITYYNRLIQNKLDGPFYSYINPFICLFDNNYSQEKENYIETILNMKYTFIFQEFPNYEDSITARFKEEQKYISSIDKLTHEKTLGLNKIVIFLQNLLDMINTLKKEKFLQLLQQNECIQISLISTLNCLRYPSQISKQKYSQFISLLIQVASQIYPYCILNYKYPTQSSFLIYITESISELIELCNFNLEEVFINHITKLIDMQFLKVSEIDNIIIQFFNGILRNCSINVIEQFINIFIKLLKQKDSSNNKDKNLGTTFQLCFNSNKFIQYIFLCFSIYKNNIGLFQFLINNCNIAKEDESMNIISIKRFLKNNYYWITICEGKNDFTRIIKKKSLFSLLEFIVLNEKSKDIMNYYLTNVYPLTKENITDKTIYLILRSGNFTLYNKFKSIMFPLKEEHIEILLDYCNRKKDNNFTNEVFKLLNLSSFELFNYFIRINYANEFVLRFYEEMSLDDKKKLLIVNNENNDNDSYKNRIENVFYSIVKLNNVVIILDLLRLYQNKNIDILLKALNASMKLDDFKCFLCFMKYDLFTQVSWNKLLEMFVQFPVYNFYIWINNNQSFLEDLTVSLQTKCKAIIQIGNILYKYSETFINEFLFYQHIKKQINKVLLEILLFQEGITLTSIIKPFLNLNNISLINSIILLMIQKLQIPILLSDLVDIFNNKPPINETYAILLTYLYEIQNNINITDMKSLFPIDAFIQKNTIKDIYNLENFPIYLNKKEIKNDSPEKQLEIISPIIKNIENNMWPTMNLLMDIKQLNELNNEKLNEIIINEKYNITNILYRFNMNWQYLLINKTSSNKSVIKLKEEIKHNSNDSCVNNFLLNETIKYEPTSKTILLIKLEMLINMYNQFMFLCENNVLLEYYYLTIKKNEIELMFKFLNEELIETTQAIINSIVNTTFLPTTSSDNSTIIHFSIKDKIIINEIIDNFNNELNTNLSKDTNIIDNYWKNLNYIYTTMDNIENIYGNIKNPFSIYNISLKFTYEKDTEKAKKNTNNSLLKLFQILTKDNSYTETNKQITPSTKTIIFSFNFEQNNILSPIETSTLLTINNFIYSLWKLVYKFKNRFRNQGKESFQKYFEYMFLIKAFSNYHLDTYDKNNSNEEYFPFQRNAKNIGNEFILNQSIVSYEVKHKVPSYDINDVEFLEFIKYLFIYKDNNSFKDAIKQALHSKDDRNSFLIYYIEKYCDAVYLFEREYLYSYIEKDILEIAKKQSKPFKSFLTYESLSPKIINSYDMISHIYKNHHKDIPNLIKNFYSHLINFNKKVQSLSKDIYNVEIQLADFTNIINLYIENNGLNFTLTKKQQWIDSYKETIFNKLSQIVFQDSDNNSLFNCVIKSYEEIRKLNHEHIQKDSYEETKEKKSFIIELLPHTWSNKKIKINRYNKENLYICFDFCISDIQENFGNVNALLNITLTPIEFDGKIKDFIENIRENYN